jgi:hypothetical protein
VAAIGVHVVEEYALHFTGWAHRVLAVPLSWQDFHLVNAAVTVYAVACAVIGWRLPSFSLSVAALVVINAVGFHLGASVVSGLYSPGTASALLLFVPLGLYAYVAAARDGVLTRRVLILSVAGGVAWHAFLAAVFAIRYFAPLYAG